MAKRHRLWLWTPAFAGVTGKRGQATYIPLVIPAQAGIRCRERNRARHWNPAFAGVTASGAGA